MDEEEEEVEEEGEEEGKEALFFTGNSVGLSNLERHALQFREVSLISSWTKEKPLFHFLCSCFWDSYYLDSGSLGLS